MTGMGDGAIFLAVSLSGFFIYQILKQISSHLWELRLLCAGINEHLRMQADSAAHEWALARLKGQPSDSSSKG